MKKIKNIFSIMLILMFIFVNIAGCSIKENKENKENNNTVVTEEVITLPEELDKIFNIFKQDDKNLAVLGKDKNDNLLYFKVDNSFDLWEKGDLNLPEDLKNKKIIEANLNSEGKLVLQYFDNNNENNELILFDIKSL